MITLFHCDSPWECTKEVIAGMLSCFMFFLFTFAFCKIIAPGRTVRLQILDGLIFYLAYVQVILEVVLNLFYSYYIIGYILILIQLFQEVLICAIFLLISGIIKKYSVFKCIVMMLIIYLLAVMGVAIYLSLITEHNEDVIECEGSIWVVLSSNNFIVSLIVLILALVSLRRSRSSRRTQQPYLETLGANAKNRNAEALVKNRKMKDFVNTFTQASPEATPDRQPAKLRNQHPSSQALLLSSDNEELERSSDLGAGGGQQTLFESSVDIKFSPSQTRPSTVEQHQINPLQNIKTLAHPLKPSFEEQESKDRPDVAFDSVAYEISQKKSDLHLLLFCSSVSVILELVWQLLIFLQIEASSCTEFQENTPLWQMISLTLLRTLSEEIVYFIIFYIIYWKSRSQLQKFNRNKDIVIVPQTALDINRTSSDSRGTSTRFNRYSSKLAVQEPKAKKSKKKEVTFHFMNEERQEERKETDSSGRSSQSHYFEAHGLTWSHLDSSTHQQSGVTSYVRSTLVKKKNKTVIGRGKRVQRKMSEGVSPK